MTTHDDYATIARIVGAGYAVRIEPQPDGRVAVSVHPPVGPRTGAIPGALGRALRLLATEWAAREGRR